jgi:hypothetical protein
MNRYTTFPYAVILEVFLILIALTVLLQGAG